MTRYLPWFPVGLCSLSAGLDWLSYKHIHWGNVGITGALTLLVVGLIWGAEKFNGS